MFKLSSLITLLERGMTSPVVENKAKGQTPSLEKTRIKGGSSDVQEAEKECSEKSGTSEKPDDGEEGDVDSSLKNEEGGEEKDHGKESRTEDKEADDENTGEVDEKYLEGSSELVNNEREEVEQSLENVVSETESNGKSVRSKEKECQPPGDSAKSESAEKDSQEDSSPKEKEEKKEVEKEEEQQQGVKRRVEEEAGGTSRKVVRQSVSVSRLADLELLASLSSSQPGLLKREREEEEEQEGEPDSKKSNTVEDECKGLEKEAASRRADVVKAKKEGKLAEENKAEQTVETPVVASTKLRDAALEASFSSSRSKHKVEEPAVEEISHDEQSFQEAATQSGPTNQAHLPLPILPSSTPLPAQSDIPTGSSSKKKEATPSPTFKET